MQRLEVADFLRQLRFLVMEIESERDGEADREKSIYET